MNNYKFPLEKNIFYEDEELNKKINEYNKIYGNFFNNGRVYNNSRLKGNYSVSNHDKKSSEKKSSSTKKINNSTNYFNELSPEIDKLSEIESEYDEYISALKLQLSKEREERKKKEEEAIQICHRLNLLKSQEQSKLLQLKKIQQRISRIINNRKKSQEKLNEKIIEKRNLYSYYKNENNRSWIHRGGGGGTAFSRFKKNTSCSNFSRKSNKSANFMSNSQNNFFISQVNHYDNEKSAGKKTKEKKRGKNSIDNFEMKKKMKNVNNNINMRLDSEENKKLFKQQLIEKIKKDEEEKKKIEEEIAKIEEEEKMLMFKLGMRGFSNKDNNKNENNCRKVYNEEEFDYGYN